MIALLLILTALLAGAIAAGTTPLTRALARRAGMLDIPAEHKTHAAPTPLLGGCAIFLGLAIPLVLVILAALLCDAASLAERLPAAIRPYAPGLASQVWRGAGILLALLGAHLMGIHDDRHAMGPWTKLAAQFVLAAFVVLICQVRILALAGPVVSVLASILWIVAITNAFNFLDNTDGLAVGVAVICTGALLAVACQTNQWFVAGLLAALLGALLGYWPFNAPPASTFMGDGGSQMIGLAVGIASCLTTYVQPGQGATLQTMLMPLAILAVPIYDTISVIALRLAGGHHPMVGDNRHFSHRLRRRGLSPAATIATIYLCTAATSLAGVLLSHVRPLVAWLLGVQVIMILIVIALLESAGSQSREPTS
jgi:UDP-GlcNAc:undecaprenyl-phosphate GlcNAc-1-phosphate transferase